MPEVSTLAQVFDFAIETEQESHDFYVRLAARSRAEHVRDVFLGMAQEELGHKARLLAIREGRMPMPAPSRVPDLKIGDYLVAQKATDDMGYAEALLFAMQKEKAAFRIYTDMARLFDGEIRDLLLSLAQEEARHKLRFEVEYDEFVLREN
jgi:rubrerythrin